MFIAPNGCRPRGAMTSAHTRGESMLDDHGHMPGSHDCVGCGNLTFRRRADDLCPRCAWQAEQLMEQIELDSLTRDLSLITRYEAACWQRDNPSPAARPWPDMDADTDQPGRMYG